MSNYFSSLCVLWSLVALNFSPLCINGQDHPTFNPGQDPKPEGQQWEMVNNLSDEFNADVFDATKWHREPLSNGWGWIGRPPGLFQPENVSVYDGSLNVTVKKLESPQVINGNTFTHGGGIVRSWASGGPGMYFEARVKANRTVMSTTFWLVSKEKCPIRKTELDIQECIGRVHDGTPDWAKKRDQGFHSNTHHRQPHCGQPDMGSKGNGIVLEEKNHSRFFIYACYWKSPTELEFFLDGNKAYEINPTTVPFDVPSFITMAIETYNWNPIPEDGGIFTTASEEERTTKYDWVRTWRLTDEITDVEIPSKKNQFGVKIYPNPAKSKAPISIELQQASRAQIQIFDIRGRLMVSTLLNGKNTKFRMGKNEPGLYLIRVTTNSGTVTQKLFIK